MTDEMKEDDVKINFPKHYKPLPEGYSVWWIDCIEHYVGMGPNEYETVCHHDRNVIRRTCFAHAAYLEWIKDNPELSGMPEIRPWSK